MIRAAHSSCRPGQEAILFKGKAEECIRQMNAELERRVIERTSQLQESNTYLTSLIEISIALNESLDLNEVLDCISDLVAQLRGTYASGSKAIVAA